MNEFCNKTYHNLEHVPKTVIVAASSQPDNQQTLEEQNLRHRVEYRELSKRIGGLIVDFSNPTHVFDRFGNRLVQPGVALRGSYLARNEDANILYMSESTGLIGSVFDRKGKTNTTVIFHHPQSPKKIDFLRYLPVHKKIDTMVFLSKAERDSFAEFLGISDSNLVVRYAPIDTCFYEPQQEVRKESIPHILSMGVSHRDYPLLINAVSCLPDVSCKISATTVSDHVDVSFGEKIPENVEIVSYSDAVSVRKQFQDCTFGVVPIDSETTQWSAGCSTVTLLQSIGKAVVATDKPGLREYMKDGETGILVKPGSIKEMREAIDYLWKNPDIAQEMGKKGRKFVEYEFGIEKWVTDMEQTLYP
jgi:glycosyltransferase involved in cell wall biosynthesis